MIPMNLTSILVLFVSAPLFLTSVLALIYSFRSRHHSTSNKESIYECGECNFVYAFARDRPMDRCPRCGHLNDALRK